MTTHSKLGASGAERWMNCPGSVALLDTLQVSEDTDEPSYRAEGTAMHEVAAECLKSGLDAWEYVGRWKNGVDITTDMADAVQVYLDFCREAQAHNIRTLIEQPVSSMAHKDMFGTVDFAVVVGQPGIPHCPIGSLTAIKVVDLKGGQGIMVEATDNPQMKYYAFCLIETIQSEERVQFPDNLPVDLTIVQPRGFHMDGPIRSWSTTWGELRAWAYDVLIPAMQATSIDDTLEAGPWCRFCPAKLVCPMLTSLFRAASTYNPQEIVHADEASLGRSYQYIQGVKFYIKALEDETFRRLSQGKEVPGTVLVHKRANRVFKSTVDDIPLADAAAMELGPDAWTKPELKSPPEIEKLGERGKEFVKRWAFKPETGLTVALASDKSAQPVTVKTLAARFGGAVVDPDAA